MIVGIAWSAGVWGEPDSLHLPLSDRGLQLGDGLFETVLIRDGSPQLLNEHLARWRTSAEQLGMHNPPAQAQLEALIAEAVERADLNRGDGALRLNWSRGSSPTRGLEAPAGIEHRFWFTLLPWTPNFMPIDVIVSRHECRNADSLLSRCKHFGYAQAIQARREARIANADDALLLNTTGELCCGTAANLLVRRQGTWQTPPLNSGCLPGIMRDKALKLGRITEHRLGNALQSGDQALLINSLGCRPIQRCDGLTLVPCNEAETLWHSLLGPKRSLKGGP